MKQKDQVTPTPFSISVHIHLRLRSGEDDDLINFFNRTESKCKARAVKAALRMGGLPTNGSIFDLIEDGAEDALSALVI
jgi:hypothetical protein